VTEVFPFSNVADVYFNDRQGTYGLYGITQGYACMRVSARIDDDAVIFFKIGFLDPVNEVTLMI
jgi:hypothetical protein